VTITNQNVMVQIIDDEKHATIAASSTVGQKMTGKSMTEKAIWVGTDIAEKAKAKKIKTVVFDRGAKLYHGRVKALAEAARAAGMEF
jgi:large subunit ribosomal protein L18